VLVMMSSVRILTLTCHKQQWIQGVSGLPGAGHQRQWVMVNGIPYLPQLLTSQYRTARLRVYQSFQWAGSLGRVHGNRSA
jgi:hypothetical protein